MAYPPPLDDDRQYSYLSQSPWGTQPPSPSAHFAAYPDAHIGYPAGGDPSADVGVGGMGVGVGVGVDGGMEGVMGLEDEAYAGGAGDQTIGGLDGNGEGDATGVKRSNSTKTPGGGGGGAGRKRRKSNASDMGGIGGTPGNKSLDKKYKQGTSCAECRRLKIKCDRGIPCAGCQKRGCAELCPEESIGSIKQLLQDRTALSARVRELEAVLHISGAGSPPHGHAHGSGAHQPFAYPSASGKGKSSSAAAEAADAGAGDGTDLLGADEAIDPHLLALSVDPSLGGAGVGMDVEMATQFPHPDTLRRDHFPASDAAKRWSAAAGGAGTIADLESGAATGASGAAAALGPAEGGFDSRPIAVEAAQAELPAESEASEAIRSLFAVTKMGWEGLPVDQKEMEGVVGAVYGGKEEAHQTKLHTLALLHAALALNAAGDDAAADAKHAGVAQRCLASANFLAGDSLKVAQTLGLLVRFLSDVPGGKAQGVAWTLHGVQGKIVLSKSLNLADIAETQVQAARRTFWSWYVAEVTGCVALGQPAGIRVDQIDAPKPSTGFEAGSFLNQQAEAAKVAHAALETSLSVEPASWSEVVGAWQSITAFEAALPQPLRHTSVVRALVSSSPAGSGPTAGNHKSDPTAQQCTLALLLSQATLQLLRPYFVQTLRAHKPTEGTYAPAFLGTVERALAVVSAVQAWWAASNPDRPESPTPRYARPAPRAPWSAWSAGLEACGLLVAAQTQAPAFGLGGTVGGALRVFGEALGKAYPPAQGEGESEKAQGWVAELQARVAKAQQGVESAPAKVGLTPETSDGTPAFFAALAGAGAGAGDGAAAGTPAKGKGGKGAAGAGGAAKGANTGTVVKLDIERRAPWSEWQARLCTVEFGETGVVKDGSGSGSGSGGKQGSTLSKGVDELLRKAGKGDESGLKGVRGARAWEGFNEGVKKDNVGALLGLPLQ